MAGPNVSKYLIPQYNPIINCIIGRTSERMKVGTISRSTTVTMGMNQINKQEKSRHKYGDSEGGEEVGSKSHGMSTRPGKTKKLSGK
jgi:hypothetical protein